MEEVNLPTLNCTVFDCRNSPYDPPRLVFSIKIFLRFVKYSQREKIYQTCKFIAKGFGCEFFCDAEGSWSEKIIFVGHCVFPLKITSARGSLHSPLTSLVLPFFCLTFICTGDCVSGRRKESSFFKKVMSISFLFGFPFVIMPLRQYSVSVLAGSSMYVEHPLFCSSIALYTNFEVMLNGGLHQLFLNHLPCSPLRNNSLSVKLFL